MFSRFLCDGLATRARRPDGEEPDGHPRPPPEVGLENGSSNPEHPAEWRRRLHMQNIRHGRADSTDAHSWNSRFVNFNFTWNYKRTLISGPNLIKLLGAYLGA